MDIFISRLKKFDIYNDYTIKELVLQKQKIYLPLDFKVKQFYCLLGNCEKQAFCKTLTYDNCEEKFIAHTFVGISGLMFRKNILHLLNNTGILPNHIWEVFQ